MSLLSRLFRRDQPPPRDVAALVAPLCRPSVRLAPTTQTTRSWLGGRPVVPPGFEWPREGDAPLGFLAQLDLAEVARACVLDWLPRSGSVVVFYDAVGQPWGFDPAHAGGWRVELVSGEGASLAPPDDLPRVGRFPQRNVATQRVQLPPPFGPELKALELTDRELDLLCEHAEALFDHGPDHHVGGFADPVQGDTMQLECQLASHGQYVGEPSGFEGPRAAALAPGADAWRLLLQVDSDPELDMCWGEGGTLYVWVRAEEARRGRFDGAWTILQTT